MESHDERTPAARRRDAICDLFDRIVEQDRMLSTVAAERARLIEQARALAIGEAVAPERSPVTASGWSAATVARREFSSELATALRIPERSAVALVEDSRSLVTILSGTLAALAAGEVSYRHAQKLIDHARSMPESRAVAFEEAVLPHARRLSVAKFDRQARIVRERLHPESLTSRATIAREQRGVYVEPARDGMAWLSAYAPAELALAAYDRVTEIAAGLKDADETRTLPQLRADVICDLLIDGTTVARPADDRVPDLSDAENEQLRVMQLDLLEDEGVERSLAELDAELRASGARPAREPLEIAPTARVERRAVARLGHGIRAKVLVEVPVLTLLGVEESPATLEGYGPIDADTARRIAADAPSFHRILTHPETGAALSVGRGNYQVPADLRTWLRVRDGTCRFPGCTAATARCEVDHCVDWVLDGETEYDNLAHLCASHHHLKHRTRWLYIHDRAPESGGVPDGALIWTSPFGRTYRTEPQRSMRGRSRSPDRRAPTTIRVTGARL